VIGGGIRYFRLAVAIEPQDAAMFLPGSLQHLDLFG
jgi:hypothetical protein